MNIAIIFPKLRGFYSKAEFWDHTTISEIDIVEIGLISAVLTHDGNQVDYYDLFYKDKDININLILRSKPYDLIFIYTEYDSLINATKISKTIKKNNQKIIVVSFGYYTIYNYQKIMQIAPQFDASIVSLDEYTLKELADCVKSNEDWRGVKGLAYRNDNKIVVLNSPRAKYYEYKMPWAIRPDGEIASAEMRTISGCTSQCIFCEMVNARHSLNFHSIKIRDVHDVIDEILYLCQNRGTKQIRFSDESFLLYSEERTKWLTDFISLCHENKIRINITANARVIDVIQYKHLLADLVDIGFDKILIGVENLLDEKLKFFRKGTTVEQNLEAYQILDDLGFNIGIGFILFDPYVTLEQIRENIVLIKTHGLYKHILGAASTLPFPIDSVVSNVANSPLYEMVERDGLETRENWYGYYFKDHYVEKYRNVLLSWNEMCPPIDAKLFKTVTSTSPSYISCLPDDTYRLIANKLKEINLTKLIELCDLVIDEMFDEQSFIMQWQEEKREIYQILEKYERES